MSRRFAVALGVLLGGFAVLAVAAYNLNTSLWFLWEGLPAGMASLPPGDIRLAYDLQQPASPSLTRFLKPWLGPDIAPLLENSEKIAISHVVDRLVVSLLPRPAWSLRAQRLLVRQLQAQGWQVERRGLAVVASRTSGEPRPSHPSLVRSVQRALRHQWPGGLSGKPFFIAKITAGVPLVLTPPVSILASSSGRDVTIAISQGDSLPSIPARLDDIYPLTNQGIMVGDLSIALPSELIAKLPTSLSISWRNLLRQQFKFVHTDPDLLAAASNNQNVMKVMLSGANAALGVAGGAEHFTALVREAVQAEEAYQRPERLAFRLPDKTIGLELVPGKVRELFGGQPASGCVQALSLWLCREGDQAALANDHHLAQAAVRSTPWHIHVAEKYARALPVPLEVLTATATPAGDIMIRAKLKND